MDAIAILISMVSDVTRVRKIGRVSYKTHHGLSEGDSKMTNLLKIEYAAM